METTKKITLDMLSETFVSVITRRFVGKDQLGDSERKGYNNSVIGRSEIIADLPAPQVASVMAVWGDKPTVINEPNNG